MNANFSKNYQNPHIISYWCVGDKAFDKDWNEVQVKERKNWKYVVVNRKQIGLSKLRRGEGYSEPIYFNYVFGGGFMNGDNLYYNQLIKPNKQIIFL